MAEETEGSSLSPEQAIARREEKLRRLRGEGLAYPNDFARSHDIASARGLPEGSEVALAGRLVQRRTAGRATFANIADGSKVGGGGTASTIQIYANEQVPEALSALGEADFGDIVGVEGELFTTRKGELTVKLERLRVLSKCLLPFAVKDSLPAELRQKRRYLVLALQPELREQFRARSRIITWLRGFLDSQGYLEVETPMLHPVQGGAAAKPFVTEHAALDRRLFLRIAPELYLKRLLVGGYDKVYEINRSFRNEGMSDQHNPEFTMLEFYEAYQDYTGYMDFIEGMLRAIALDEDAPWASGVLDSKGRGIDFAKPFARLSLAEAIAEHCGCGMEEAHDPGFLGGLLDAKESGKAREAISGGDVGRLQLLAFEKRVEPLLREPTYVTGYPASVSPLSRRRPGAERGIELADRFELFIDGREIANGFSELNDPDEQHAVFEQQVAAAAAGDEEAMQYDADYIRALRYGMPPAAGAGLGIDRLAMLLLGADSIRDVILFPQQRPEASDPE